MAPSPQIVHGRSPGTVDLQPLASKATFKAKGNVDDKSHVNNNGKIGGNNNDQSINDPQKPSDMADFPDYANYNHAVSYSKTRKAGEGTYAVVYEGFDVRNNRRIAIKKIKLGQFKDGMDLSAIREIKFLREFKHENIVEMVDVYHHHSSLHLILEFLPSDLEVIIRNKALIFSEGDVKSWMIMLLRGLRHCHTNFVVHRDLKPNNLLLAEDGTLKLADFGLAREFGSPDARMTSQAVTRWYRPPELLMGAKQYGTSVDIWSTGCIFAELMLRNPYFAGATDFEQLSTIFQGLGTPTELEWPDMTSLPGYLAPVKKIPRPDQRRLFSAASSDALDLLSKMLVYDPKKRLNAEEALCHPWFSERPKPTRKEKLAKFLRGENSSSGPSKGKGKDGHTKKSNNVLKRSRDEDDVQFKARKRKLVVDDSDN